MLQTPFQYFGRFCLLVNCSLQCTAEILFAFSPLWLFGSMKNTLTKFFSTENITVIYADKNACLQFIGGKKHLEVMY